MFSTIDPADASAMKAGRQGERSAYFVTWPVHEGERFVAVRIATKELAHLSGEAFAQHPEDRGRAGESTEH